MSRRSGRRSGRIRRRRTFPRRRIANRSRRLKYRVSRPPVLGTTLPNSMMVKLVYAQRVALNGVGSSYNTWSGNSLYDPDVSGSGSQPTGFDQWAALYQKYRVHSSKIRCTVSQLAATAGNVTLNALVPSVYKTTVESNTPLVDITNPRGKFCYSSVNTGTGQKMMRHYCSTASIMGIPKSAIRTSPEYGAAVSANPNVQWYWTFKSAALDGTSTLNGYVDVKITYYAEFYFPYSFAAS